MAEKRCKQCNKLMPIEMFYKKEEYSDGHFNICKECYKNNARIKYSKKHKNNKWRDKYNEYHKDYYNRFVKI